MKKTSANPAASILAKLRNVSSARGLDHTQTLTQFAIERLLYRLSISKYKERFLLKGAMLFLLWENNPHRSTRDLDLLGFGNLSLAAAKEIFTEITSLQVPEDCLIFDSSSIECSEIRALEEYCGVHVSMQSRIEKVVISVQVDIGVGDSVVPPPKQATFPTLLDLPAPQLAVYPMETAIAEKLHAIAKLGMLNTRMKDYFDLYHLGSRYEFDGQAIAAAVQATFSRRADAQFSSELIGLSAAFVSDATKQLQWKAFLRKNRIAETGPDLAKVVCLIASFAGPVLDSLKRKAAFTLQWKAEGGWK